MPAPSPRCIPIVCPNGQVQGPDCECTFEPYEVCQRQDCIFPAYKWISEPICSCQYRCRQLTCFAGFEFDLLRCECVKICPTVECGPNFQPNQITCECECAIQDCPSDYIIDLDECICIQPSTSTTCTPQKCRNRYVWLQEQCQCVCPPYVCLSGTVRGSDCDCLPAPTSPIPTTDQCEPQACSSGLIWRPSPTCECTLACDVVQECLQGQKWDTFECKCVLNGCQPIQCDDRFRFNSTTCNCECLLTENCCPGKHEYLNNTLCECQKI